MKVDTIPRRPICRGLSLPPHKNPGMELTATPISDICCMSDNISCTIPRRNFMQSLSDGFPECKVCRLCCISMDMVLTVLRIQTIFSISTCLALCFVFFIYLTIARYIVDAQQYETPLQKNLLSKRKWSNHYFEKALSNCLVYQLLKLVDLLTMQYAPMGNSMCWWYLIKDWRFGWFDLFHWNQFHNLVCDWALADHPKACWLSDCYLSAYFEILHLVVVIRKLIWWFFFTCLLWGTS